MIRYGGGERDNFTLFGFRPDVIDKDVQKPPDERIRLFHLLLEGGAVDDDDGRPLRRPGAGHSGLGIDQRNLAEDAALADPSQDRFDPVDDLENLHLTGLDDIGQVAFFAFLENPVPGLQGLPLKYGF